MRLEIEIQDDKLQNLTPDGNTEVLRISKKYIEDVLDEANRIELSRRTTAHNSEITASIINDAAFFARNFGVRKKRPQKKIFIPIIAFIASTITGGLFDIEKFKETIYVIVFLIVFSTAIVLTLLIILNDETND